jgi:hypothetical protein
MIAPLAKLIDWYAIQFLTMRCRGDGRNPHLFNSILAIRDCTFAFLHRDPAASRKTKSRMDASISAPSDGRNGR